MPERGLPLGKAVSYPDRFAPEVLCRVERAKARRTRGIKDAGMFEGFDLWNCWECSWLLPGGLPRTAVGRLIYSADSKFIVESKSLKLFLMSLNNEIFNSAEEAANVIAHEIEVLLESSCRFSLSMPEEWKSEIYIAPSGRSLDNLSLCTGASAPSAGLLRLESKPVDETVYTNLFRSRCPVTDQPDWGTVVISYQGQKISDKSLLSYLVSYRNQQGFHESCCERIYCDLFEAANPKKLYVALHCLRRGGIDINPVRFSRNLKHEIGLNRFYRQ